MEPRLLRAYISPVLVLLVLLVGALSVDIVNEGLTTEGGAGKYSCRCGVGWRDDERSGARVVRHAQLQCSTWVLKGSSVGKVVG